MITSQLPSLTMFQSPIVTMVCGALFWALPTPQTYFVVESDWELRWLQLAKVFNQQFCGTQANGLSSILLVEYHWPLDISL